MGYLVSNDELHDIASAGSEFRYLISHNMTTYCDPYVKQKSLFLVIIYRDVIVFQGDVYFRQRFALDDSFLVKTMAEETELPEDVENFIFLCRFICEEIVKFSKSNNICVDEELHGISSLISRIDG